MDTEWREPDLPALNEGGDLEATSGAVAAAAYGLATATGQWRDIRRRFVRNKLAVAGLVMIGFIVLIAIFAPELAPYKPDELDLSQIQKPPSAHHWFGTDLVGRDQLTRVMYGARIALIVGISSIVLSVLIGVILGAIAGYFGRFWDSLIMRICDIFFAFPILVGAIVIITVVGQGITAGDPGAGDFRLGDHCAAAARFDSVRSRVRVRRGGPLARGQSMAHRDPPHPAEQLRPGADLCGVQRR